MFIDLRERERERETMWEKYIKCLPPIHAPTGDWTFNLLVYRMTLQTTEPPGQGQQTGFEGGKSKNWWERVTAYNVQM